MLRTVGFFAAIVMVSCVNLTEVSVFVSSSGNIDRVVDGLQPGADAVGRFEDSLNTTGWGKLDVRTQHQGYSDSDSRQMYAAGAAEGYITAPRIWEHYLNMRQSHFGHLNQSEVQTVNSFLESQYQWAKDTAQSHNDSFWTGVGAILQQFEGLVDGYNTFAANASSFVPSLTRVDFLMLNGDGDLFQIIPAVLPHRQVNLHSMKPAAADQALQDMGKCSSIIKVLGNFSDLFMGHSSWYTFSATNRIFKHYNFASLVSSSVKGHKTSFSSYPGYLESLDDFYMMDSGLGMVQTSINFANPELYKLIHSATLLAWQRVRTANLVASTGKEWHTAVSTAFSGTYCNQYMIIDYKRFVPGRPLAQGTLWVVEEIPGQIPGADMTEILSYGYWPSYNVPYFPQVYAISGLPQLAERGVPSASYQMAPRATIFRRDEGSIIDLDSYGSLLRSNTYETDPYANGDPCHTVCCRADLRKIPSASGCYDTKITNSSLFFEMKAHVINGPTHGGADDLPTFSWSRFPKTSHIGLPPVYNFSWVWMTPAL